LVNINKKHVGFILFLSGILFAIYGLSIYLEGPKENGTSIIDCTYDVKTSIWSENNEKFYFYRCDDPVWIDLASHVEFMPGLILEREINFSLNQTYSLAFFI
jgi:hypothetical protein